MKLTCHTTGLWHSDDVDGIQRIDYFAKNDMKIKEIECYVYYSVMMDYSGCVWMFGENRLGVIGD